MGAAPAGANLVYAVVDLDDKDAAPGWKPYEGPVAVERPGEYAVLAKAVPRRADAQFEPVWKPTSELG